MAAPAATTNVAVRASVVALMTTTFGPASAYAGAVHDSRSNPIDEDHTHPAVVVIADIGRETPLAMTEPYMDHGLTVQIHIYAVQDDGDEAALADTLDAMMDDALGALFGDDDWRVFFLSAGASTSRQLVDSTSRRARGKAVISLDLSWEVDHAQTDAPADEFDVASIVSTEGTEALVTDIHE